MGSGDQDRQVCVWVERFCSRGQGGHNDQDKKRGLNKFPRSKASKFLGILQPSRQITR